jgi:hypothetical protein
LQIGKRVLTCLIVVVLSGCNGGSESVTTTGIPPVVTGEGVTMATGVDAIAFRKAQALCSEFTLQTLAQRYGVKRNHAVVVSAVAANEFPASREAAAAGCGNGSFGSS